VSSGAAGGEPAWNDTWAKELTDEERARALASLGEALAGGTTLSADAASTWAKTERRTGPRRGSAAGEGADAARAGRQQTRRASAYEADSDDPFAGAATVGGGARDGDGEGTESASRSGFRSRDLEGPDDADASGDSGDGGSGTRRGRGGRRGRGRSGPRWSSATRDDGTDPDGGRAARSADRTRRRGPAQIDPDQDPEAAARAICLRLLTGQPRTRAQLADALRQRGVPDEVADHVLGRFTEVKLIDDAAFAHAWVDTRHVGRGLAKRALARELRHRGVAAEVVTEAVERLDPEQELATARVLVAKRLPATRGKDRQVRMRRLAGMLARKGYPEGLALRVVREALDAEADQDDGDDDEAWTYDPQIPD
jgi:regulatory protein